MGRTAAATFGIKSAACLIIKGCIVDDGKVTENSSPLFPFIFLRDAVEAKIWKEQTKNINAENLKMREHHLSLICESVCVDGYVDDVADGN